MIQWVIGFTNGNLNQKNTPTFRLGYLPIEYLKLRHPSTLLAAFYSNYVGIKSKTNAQNTNPKIRQDHIFQTIGHRVKRMKDIDTSLTSWQSEFQGQTLHPSRHEEYRQWGAKKETGVERKAELRIGDNWQTHAVWMIRYWSSNTTTTRGSENAENLAHLSFGQVGSRGELGCKVCAVEREGRNANGDWGGSSSVKKWPVVLIFETPSSTIGFEWRCAGRSASLVREEVKDYDGAQTVPGNREIPLKESEGTDG